MYKVEKFEVSDEKLLLAVMEQYPFATVATVFEGEPFINHLPLTTMKDTENRIRIFGHMSKRNPQWLQMKAGSKTVVSFQGPHAYVNPIWYKENDVPTWNYIVVQASGKVRVVEDYEGIIDILQKTTDHMNRIHSDQWEFELPWDLRSKGDLTSAIVGFELTPEKIAGKFKLSQNRKREDCLGVIDGLRNREDQSSRAVAQWMEKLVD